MKYLGLSEQDFDLLLFDLHKAVHSNEANSKTGQVLLQVNKLLKDYKLDREQEKVKPKKHKYKVESLFESLDE